MSKSKKSRGKASTHASSGNGASKAKGVPPPAPGDSPAEVPEFSTAADPRPTPASAPPSPPSSPTLRGSTFPAEIDALDVDELARATLEPRDDIAEISAFVDVDALDARESTVPEAASDARASRAGGDVAQELRDVEAELDRMWAGRPKRDAERRQMQSVVARSRGATTSSESAAPNAGAMRANVAATTQSTASTSSSDRIGASDVLATDYYARQWGRIGLRNRAEEVDDFGLDPAYEKRFQPLFDFLFKHYFRTEVVGADQVPADGRCLLVANHSGVLPYDGIMARTAMRHRHPSGRDLRWLAEDFIFHLPFLGAFMNRIGAVRACQENAERLLRQERAVLVFPEGIKGVGKLYKDRYRLQRFGRGGFIKLALRTGAPIVPVSIVGAEESAPMLYRIEYLTRAVGLPFVPVTPTFPWLGPLGLVPAPTKWRITFGAPIVLGDHGAEAAEDALLVVRLADRVRGEIQKMLDRDVAARRSVWF